MREKKSRARRILRAVLCTALILAACVCFGIYARLSALLPSQQAAKRWQGEGEVPFGQSSCFLPVDETLTLEQVYQFRASILEKLQEAGYEADYDTLLYRDAWCGFGKVNVSSELGHGEASLIAVGGDFFSFHPLRLLSGNYISESDLMKDQILLDEDLAWLLFGGSDLQGLEVKLNGVPFVVAGVVEREQDFASQKAYTSGMGLFMSYEAFSALDEKAAISCYELIMAEPVKDYTVSFVREKIPIGQGVIVANSQRYSVWSLLKLLGQFGSRSMQKQGVILPYWENAARCVEDWCTLFLLLGLLATLYPLIIGVMLLIRLLRKGKEKLTERLLPGGKERVSELVRRFNRRRWERKHRQ